MVNLSKTGNDKMGIEKLKNNKLFILFQQHLLYNST